MTTFPDQITVEILNPETPFGGVQIVKPAERPVQLEINTGSPVRSVFGRIGDILADCDDYALCYAPLGAGIPGGGLTGQTLAKLSDTGYDVGWTNAGAGSVTDFSAGNLSPLFSTSVATSTSTPALSFSLSNASAHTFLGNNTGGSAAPAYVQPAFSDLSGDFALSQTPSAAADKLIGRGNGGGAGDWQEITLGTNLSMSGTTLNATGGGGTPGGSNTQVQFNDGGVFGGDADFTWDKTGNVLTMTGNVTSTSDLNFTLPSTGVFKVSQNPSAGSPTLGRVNIGWVNTNGTSKSSQFTWYSNTTPLWSIVNDLPANGSLDFAIYDNTNSASRLYFNATATSMPSNQVFGWGSVATGSTLTLDTALARNAAGVVEINNGTAGQYRDLIARYVTATTEVSAAQGNSTTPGLIIQGGMGAWSSGAGQLYWGLGATTPIGFDNGTTKQLALASGTRLGFSDNGNPFSGTLDLALYRNAAGIVEINNGTAGQYRDLYCRNIALQSSGAITGNGSVPTGGTTNQVLQKNSNTNYDVGWTTLAGGGNVSNSGTPTADQLPIWTDSTHIKGVTGLLGGTTGQVLKKSSNTDYDWAWGAAGSGTPGGADTNIQYNDSGTFGGDANLTWNKTTFVETLTGNQNAITSYIVQNNSAGTSAQAAYISKNGTYQANYGILGTGTVTTQIYRANQGYLYTDGTGGLGLIAANGSGPIQFATGGSDAQVAITSAGQFQVRGDRQIGWSSTTDPIGSPDTALARNSAGVLEIDNGTAGQWGALKAGVRDAATNTVADGLTLGHQSTATPVGAFGTGLLFNANDSTTADVNAARIKALWTTATHNSNVSDFVFELDNGSTTPAEAFRITGGGIANAKTGYQFNSAEFPIAANGIPVRTGANAWSVATITSPISLSTATLSLNLATNFQFTATQSITVDDGNANLILDELVLTHTTSGTPAIGLGVGIQFNAETSIQPRTQGEIGTAWSNVTDANRTAYMDFLLVDNAAAIASKMRLFPSGGLSVNNTTDPGAGVINANTGFKLGGAEFPVASNGLVKRTAANTYSAVTAPSGAVVGDTDTQTLTNKRINPRVDDQNPPTSPYACNSDSFDVAVLRGINAALTLNAPTGTPVQGQKLIFRFKDNGTARALTFQTGSAGQFRFSTDMAAPTTTIINATLYMGFIYNTTDSRWDNVSQMNNF